ncbi:UNVERIFIED_CONTAM: hypothetical protein K2H54_057964 [Gekko kuhli]
MAYGGRGNAGPDMLAHRRSKIIEGGLFTYSILDQPLIMKRSETTISHRKRHNLEVNSGKTMSESSFCMKICKRREVLRLRKESLLSVKNLLFKFCLVLVYS